MTKNKGQTLIEVLVALAAIVVVTSAITIAVITSLNNAEYSKTANLATQYAQQAMEQIKSMRNTDYATFASLVGNYCYAKACAKLVSTTDTSNPCWQKQGQYCVQNVDTFVREIALEQNSATCGGIATKVTVKISWADSKCTDRTNLYCHQEVLVSCMSNYQNVPLP